MKTVKGILNTALETVADRGPIYASPELCFERVSSIVSVIANRTISPYECVMVHVATKLARIAQSQKHEDSYVDAAAYLAIAAQLTNGFDDKPADVQQAVLNKIESDLARLTVPNENN
jgi:hypothetical protein